MKQVKLLLSCILVGVVVAITYFLFESFVHSSIDYIWNSLFDTEEKRLLIIPISLVLALVYFGAQHWLDKKSENHESHGLGGEQLTPALRTLMTILLIGYFSLIAGASLGPEAILVPACMVIGLYTGTKLFKKDTQTPKALAAAGIMALFTAFFNSFFVGVLAIFLVSKQTKIKINSDLVAVALVSSASSYLTLQLIDPRNSYFNWPALTWRIAFIDLLFGIMLIIVGYASTISLKYSHHLIGKIKNRVSSKPWWQHAIVAALGLSSLYLVGGHLVEFTGNQSIAPMVEEAPRLGIVGLSWIIIIKLLAISWSKIMGYRGGLIFPMIFVASAWVAMAQIVNNNVNFGIGLLFTLVGILAAEKRAKILL